jgi:hypothetical protein
MSKLKVGYLSLVKGSRINNRLQGQRNRIDGHRCRKVELFTALRSQIDPRFF